MRRTGVSTRSPRPEADTSLRRGRLLGLLLALASAAPAGAAELLRGQAGSLPFSLHGESRDDVVGGEMRLGEQRFRIERVSRLRLIGGRNDDGTRYAVFSSSFSAQTASGRPWVAARRHEGCDGDYNTFVAVYEVSDPNKRTSNGAVPYGRLTESNEHSDDGTVYCFMSRPPG